MRALFRRGGKVELGEAPEPVPAPGEALIRPTMMGISSSDLAVARGRLAFEGVMGHEFVGVVEKAEPARGAAPESASRWVGRRVVGSIAVACGTCPLCRGGLAQHCPQRSVIGLHGRNGCFADRLTLPLANLVEVPKGVDDARAVFSQAAAAALHAIHMLRIEGKPYVTVLGDGVMGLLCAQVMARRNASVRLLGARAEKFTLCERWGIKHRHAGEVGKRQDQDVVVDCTGSPAGLDLALSLVRPRGKVLLKSAPAPIPAAALPPGEPGADLARAVVNEIEIIGSRCGRLGEGLGAIAQGEVDVLPLVSARSRLGEAPAALRAASQPESVRVVMEA